MRTRHDNRWGACCQSFLLDCRVPLLVCIPVDDDDEPPGFSLAYRPLFLTDGLRIGLLEAEREVSVRRRFDVVPVRSSGRDPSRSKRRSRIIKFDIAQRHLAVVLNRDVDSAGVAGESQDRAEADYKVENCFCPTITHEWGPAFSRDLCVRESGR